MVGGGNRRGGGPGRGERWTYELDLLSSLPAGAMPCHACIACLLGDVFKQQDGMGPSRVWSALAHATARCQMCSPHHCHAHRNAPCTRPVEVACKQSVTALLASPFRLLLTGTTTSTTAVPSGILQSPLGPAPPVIRPWLWSPRTVRCTLHTAAPRQRATAPRRGSRPSGSSLSPQSWS